MIKLDKNLENTVIVNSKAGVGMKHIQAFCTCKYLRPETSGPEGWYLSLNADDIAS